MRVTFAEALALLQINDGRAVDQVVDDFDTPTEKRLGDIIKQKHGVDFFFIHKHSTARLIYKKGRVKLCERGTMGICWRIAFDILRTSDARMGQEQRLHPECCLINGLKIRNPTEII